MIHVLATIELQDGQRDAFLQELWRIVPLVRAETGCVEYGPTVDVAIDLMVPTPMRPNTVVIVEKWESIAHLKVHLGAPHMIDYRVRIRPYVSRVSLQVLEPAPQP